MKNSKLFVRDVKRMSNVEIVVDTIKKLLIGKKLKPGDLLPSEKDLSESLSISRGSIREAMKILSAFGVVEVKQGDGTYVATNANKSLFDPVLFNLLATNPDLEELVELRLLVEEGIIKLIIKHASDPELNDLRKICLEMEENARKYPDDVDRLLQNDLDFHLLMGKLTGNKLVDNVYSFVVELYAPTMHPGTGIETHKKLVDAFYSRDLNTALAAIKEHDDIWHQLHKKASK